MCFSILLLDHQNKTRGQPLVDHTQRPAPAVNESNKFLVLQSSKEEHAKVLGDPADLAQEYRLGLNPDLHLPQDSADWRALAATMGRTVAISGMCDL